jgi:hypothetical protein
MLPGGGLTSVSRLAHIPGIGVDEIGDAAAAGNPDLLRLENLGTDIPPPAVARQITHTARDRLARGLGRRA